MSFSNDVKNELSRIETNDATGDKAELLGLLRMSGAIVIRGMNIGIHFSTENAALARRVLQLLKSNYQVQTEVVITRSRRLKKNNRYQVHVVPAPQVSKALNELQLLSVEGDLKIHCSHITRASAPFCAEPFWVAAVSAVRPVITIWRW